MNCTPLIFGFSLFALGFESDTNFESERMSESIDEFSDIRIIESEIQQNLDEMTKNVENMENIEVPATTTTVSSGCGPSPERDFEPVTEFSEPKVIEIEPKSKENEQIVKPIPKMAEKTKVSTGCGPSPPRELIIKSPTSKISTGTSPPPQTISTQVSKFKKFLLNTKN